MDPAASVGAATAAPTGPQQPEAHSHPSTTSDYAAAFAHAVEHAIDGVAEAIQGVSADLPSPMELEGNGNGRFRGSGDFLESVTEAVAAGEGAAACSPSGVHEDEFDWEQVGGDRRPAGGGGGARDGSLKVVEGW